MNTSELISALMRKRDELIESNPAAIESIIDQLDLKPDNIVLDAAVGSGSLLPYLTRRLTATGWVDAYDASAGLLEQAAAAHEASGKVRFILGDVESDAIFGAYDAIIIFGMLPAFNNPINAVKRLYDDHLMPGGHIVIGFACSKEEINSLRLSLDENIASHQADESETNFLDSAEELAARLTAAGMNVTYTLDTDSAYTIILKK